MSDFLKPYAEYREAGLPWLGEIPRHWTVLPIGRVASVQLSSVDKLTHEEELPVQLCNYVDVYKNDFITRRLPFMTATASQIEMSRFALEVGDVLITKDSETWNDIAVPALVTEELPGVLCGYHLAQIRPSANVLLGPYLFRSLQALPIAEQFHVLATGVTRFGLSKRAIKSGTIPVPPIEEQQAIARFLDRQDRRINRFIRAKRRLIDLLNEQKQAIIHQAVTRGLDPSAPLKPSGVAWLGDIPAHWEMQRTKYICTEIDQRSSTGGETHLSMSQKQGLVRSADLQERHTISADYTGGKLCEPNDLVLNRLKAHLGVFALAPERGVISPDYSVFRIHWDHEPRYFEAVLKTPAWRFELRQRVRGIVEGLWRLYTDDFYQILVPVPPFSEQQAIVEQLREASESIGSAIARAQAEIDLLREYRARLIADVVTGKLDVRNHPAVTGPFVELGDELEAPDPFIESNEEPTEVEDHDVASIP